MNEYSLAAQIYIEGDVHLVEEAVKLRLVLTDKGVALARGSVRRASTEGSVRGLIMALCLKTNLRWTQTT